LTEKQVPECAGYSYAFKAFHPAHSKLWYGWRNAEGGRKDKQAGICFDRNRLNRQVVHSLGDDPMPPWLCVLERLLVGRFFLPIATEISFAAGMEEQL